MDRGADSKHNSIWLDWLRFLAALEVMLSHARGTAFVDFASLPPPQQNLLSAVFFLITRLGNEAVVVFFVLSGFLVGGRGAELALAGRFSVGRYAVDRISRIATVLLPALGFTAIAEVIAREPVSAALLVGNALSLQGVLVGTPALNAPLWSLSFEVWFYVLAGAVAFVVSHRRSNAWATALIALSMLVFVRLGFAPLAWWALGALLFFDNRRRISPSVMFVACAIALTAVGLYQLGRPANIDGSLGTAAGVLDLTSANTLLAVGIALLLPQLRSLRLWAEGPLFRSGRFLAAFSFSLYLTHYPTLALVEMIFPARTSLTVNGFLAFATYVAASMAVALGFYLAFEKHTESVRRWLWWVFGAMRDRFSRTATKQERDRVMRT